MSHYEPPAADHLEPPWTTLSYDIDGASESARLVSPKISRGQEV